LLLNAISTVGVFAYLRVVEVCAGGGGWGFFLLGELKVINNFILTVCLNFLYEFLERLLMGLLLISFSILLRLILILVGFGP
jgi:hypothetical protein